MKLSVGMIDANVNCTERHASPSAEPSQQWELAEFKIQTQTFADKTVIKHHSEFLNSSFRSTVFKFDNIVIQWRGQIVLKVDFVIFEWNTFNNIIKLAKCIKAFGSKIRKVVRSENWVQIDKVKKLYNKCILLDLPLNWRVIWIENLSILNRLKWIA